MALTYTTVEDFEAYPPGWVTDNVGALTLLLERAERAVDAILGPIPRDSTTGLKLDPTQLLDWEAEALSRAVCAQAEYLFTIGTTGDIVPRAGKIKGPDFEQDFTGTPGVPVPSIGPKVKMELEPIHHLRRLSGYLV